MHEIDRGTVVAVRAWNEYVAELEPIDAVVVVRVEHERRDLGARIDLIERDRDSFEVVLATEIVGRHLGAVEGRAPRFGSQHEAAARAEEGADLVARFILSRSARKRAKLDPLANGVARLRIGFEGAQD